MNILIVDDQKEVIQGILSNILWSEMPHINHVFHACSAMEAKHILTNQTVDIIVSDIEMPEEDGISLINWVRNQFPETKCIFLTAHANFDYAQNAVRLNAVDYILQPVSYDALRASIEKAVFQILKQKENFELINHNSFWKTHTAELERQLWLNFIGQENPNSSAFLEKLKNLNIRIPQDCFYTVMIVEQLQAEDTLENWINQTSLDQTTGLAHEFLKAVSLYQCQIDQTRHQYIHIVCTSSNEEELSSILQTFRNMCQNDYDLTLAIYFGCSQTLHELPALYQQLIKKKNDNVAAYSGLFNLHTAPREQCTSLPSTQNWSNYFTDLNADLILETLNVYFTRSIDAGTMNHITLLTLQQYFLFAFHKSLHDRGIRFRTVMGHEDVLSALSISTRSVSDFMHFAQTVVNINKTLQKAPKPVPANLIEQAQSYITDHIASNELSRQNIAQSLFVSEGYLSHLFQKELGISLTDYIVKQRMNLAKSMLTNTNMPIQFIAMKTGYNSVSYFTKAFKKNFGITPAELRQTT